MSRFSPELRQKLIHLYHQESALNQYILQGFSVIYEPITRTDFLKCFQATEQRDKLGKSYTSKTLKPHLDHLLSLHLLVEGTETYEKNKIRCHPAIVELVTQDSVAQNIFTTWVTIIDLTLPIEIRSCF